MLIRFPGLRFAPALGTLGLGLSLGTAALAPSSAEACGCFAPPDPSVPIVQAGEEIVFSYEPGATPQEQGVVTAHIKIFYEGPAEEFGWLLPLPSVPDWELGVEELFVQILNTTQPRYRLNTTFDRTCGDFDLAIPDSTGGGRNEGGTPPPKDIVVKQDSLGPFDMVVLSAEDRTAMFNWLTNNGFFIPQGLQAEGENDVVRPYIKPDAFFLALRLRAGNGVGDLQPIVVRYASKRPMIPIVLTSVAANPNMGIRVWVLGDTRAIPQNYLHTVINVEFIDWFNFGSNYNDVIINATNEAQDGQSFVTEYAGDTDRMRKVLNWEGRFGDRGVLSGLNDVTQYVQALRANGFTWDSALTQALQEFIPYPDRLATAGVTKDLFYANLDWYLGGFRSENPTLFEGYTFEFMPVSLTDRLWERIVEPTLKAGALFDAYPQMTRMYTTLSPEEMTKDPVFSFNPSLPPVDNEHVATLRQLCSSEQPTGESILALPDGREFFIRSGSDWINRNRDGVPFSRRIEQLTEEGPPVVKVNNASRISQGDANLDGCGCSTTYLEAPHADVPSLFAAALLGLALLVRRRSR